MNGMRLAAGALAVIFATLDASAAGAYLATGGRITSVVIRNNGTTELMEIEVTGATGPCAALDISFPTTGNADRDNRMVSLATAALLSGKKVRIYDYDFTASPPDCTRADFISLYE